MGTANSEVAHTCTHDLDGSVLVPAMLVTGLRTEAAL